MCLKLGDPASRHNHIRLKTRRVDAGTTRNATGIGNSSATGAQERPARLLAATSARNRSSRRAMRRPSAPGAFIASHMAANLRCRRIRSLPARSAEPRRRCAISSLPAIPSGSRSHQKGGISNRPTTRPRARTSRRQISTVSRIPRSELTKDCSSATVCGGSSTSRMPAFIGLWPCESGHSADMTTSGPGLADSLSTRDAEDQQPGPTIRIAGRPAASPEGWSGPARTARPVSELNGFPSMLAGICRPYRSRDRGASVPRPTGAKCSPAAR